MTPQLHLLQIHLLSLHPTTVSSKFTRLRNAILITGYSMIPGIDEKILTKKYPVKVCPFPRASVDDMYHYLRRLLQKRPDTVILHVGTKNCVK